MRRLPTAKYLSTAKYLFQNALAGESLYPFYASFKVTRRCNFACRFCNCWRVNWDDLSTQDVYRVLDNIGRSSVVVTSLEGGDPLVRDDIGQILRHAHGKPFYLFITTSERELWEYPMEEYGKCLDYLHISIDEGHRNLDMFDHLDTFASWGPPVCIQIVVMDEDLPALPEKVRRCHEAGVKCVIMAAVHIPGTKSYYPNVVRFRETVLALKAKYPGTVTSPDRYFDNLFKEHGCAPSSIVVDADAQLFYPCRVLEKKAIDMREQDLMAYLESGDAAARRAEMRACELRCGWYQYFATNAFASLRDMRDAMYPYVRDVIHPAARPAGSEHIRGITIRA